MPTLEARTLDALRRKGWTLACAESCTGGLLGARLTDPPRASDVFRGSLVTYQDDVKAEVLGVERVALERLGGVSREVAHQMATRVRERLRADVGVSITGFAGPDVPPGGELGKVFIGLAHPGGVEVHEFHFPDERAKVREGAVVAALELVLAVVQA